MCEKKFKCPACGGEDYIAEILGVLINGQPVRSCLAPGCKFSWVRPDDDKYIVEQKPHPNQKYIDAINNGQTVYWLKPRGWNPEGLMEPVTAHELTIAPNDKSYGPGRLFIAGTDIPERPTDEWVAEISRKYQRKFELSGCCRAPLNAELCVWQAGFHRSYDIAKWSRGYLSDSRGYDGDMNNWRWIVNDLGPIEPTYTPWNENTVNREAWLKRKICTSREVYRILRYSERSVRLSGVTLSWDELLKLYVQIDGSPCGTKQ